MISQAFDDLGLVPQAAVFQWIGNLECFVTEHSRFCEAYEPYTAQLHNGPFPGICCFTLSSNTNLDLDVERDDDGQTKIFIKNAYTTGLLGVIPSVFSVVLLPLLMGGIVRASGKIETLIHPDSCPPPFKLILSANLSMISTAHDFDDAITNALTQLRRWLKRPKGVFVTPELPANIQSIRKVLNRPKKWRSKAQQSQQLAQHPWYRVVSSSSRPIAECVRAQRPWSATEATVAGRADCQAAAGDPAGHRPHAGGQTASGVVDVHDAVAGRTATRSESSRNRRVHRG